MKKIHIAAWVAVMALLGVAKAEMPKMEGFLVPASPECFVTVMQDGTVSKLNVLGNGSLKYDDTGRIEQIGGARIKYDDTGHIKSIKASDFKYDDAGRIQQIGTMRIRYDKTGRIQQIGSAKITYDDTGRVDGIKPGIAASI